MYKTIKDLKIKKGDKVLLRLDFNVPIINNKIVNARRINESVSGILKLQKKGVKLMIIAHKEGGDLEIVFNYLKKKIKKIKFIKAKVVNFPFKKVVFDFENELNNLKNGEIILLDNLRLHEGEKKNDDNFAKSLSIYFNYYINDAFSASHRKHASIVGIPKIIGKKNSAIGDNFANEIQKLELGLKPKHPVLLILGGAKFETKLNLLEKYVDVADKIFIGGALAHVFWKLINVEIGKSLIDNEVKLSEKVIQAFKKSKIILPMDVITDKRKNIAFDCVNSDEVITDFGVKTLEGLKIIASQCKTIIWNGPLGFYEHGYDWGTKEILKSLGKMKTKKIIIGGGDTVAVVEKVLKSNQDLKFTHVSTGGGAMIDYLSNGSLPGIDALK